jgi:hypothetical protein
MFKSSSHLLSKSTTRFLSTTPPRTLAAAPKMDAFKAAGNRKDAPPAHDMVHFSNLLSEKRSFGDFRTVLHTGLFSQLVAMEVPVGGDIGDEVSDQYNRRGGGFKK